MHGDRKIVEHADGRERCRQDGESGDLILLSSVHLSHSTTNQSLSILVDPSSSPFLFLFISSAAQARTGDPMERERLLMFAKNHVMEISDVLAKVPSKLLLLFKTNDTLKYVRRWGERRKRKKRKKDRKEKRKRKMNECMNVSVNCWRKKSQFECMTGLHRFLMDLVRLFNFSMSHCFFFLSVSLCFLPPFPCC